MIVTVSLNELLDLIRMVEKLNGQLKTMNDELSAVRQGSENAKKELAEAREEIEAGNKLLEDHNDLLRMIPACTIHGDQCVPNAREWVEKFTALYGAYEETKKMGAGWTNRDWARIVVSAYAALAEAKTEIADYEASFELYDEACRRGIKMWQEATGDKRIWPDQAKLIAWLMDRLDAYENNICLQCNLTMEAVLVITDKDTINEATGEEEITLSSGEITVDPFHTVCTCTLCLVGYSNLCSEKDDKEK